MQAPRRVVVTGLGAVTPLGNPLTLNATLSVKPPEGVTVIGKLAPRPAVTL